MSTIRPFRAFRPAEKLAPSIAALPYDVYTSSEARRVVAAQPLSFLKIDRAETLLPEGTDLYSEEVYRTARDTLDGMIRDGSFLQDPSACYYVYALTMNGRTQTGLVGCASIDDYMQGIILRHENTLEAKEQDRIRHIDACSAQTGPIFLTHRPSSRLRCLLQNTKETLPLYDFLCEDGVRHQVWKISSAKEIEEIGFLFSQMDHLYIADGHHRAASAVKVGLSRRAENPDRSGEEGFFLSVLFPSDELEIFGYDRVVTDKNGYTTEQIFDRIKDGFEMTGVERGPFRPAQKGEFGVFSDGVWYRLKARPHLLSAHPVKGLDVSILQDHILSPVLGIHNPKNDSRIRFIGAIKGLQALEQAAQKSGGIAFSMHPTSMDELLCIADHGLLMPPKSTWFEPKLRSGLFIHRF